MEEKSIEIKYKRLMAIVLRGLRSKNPNAFRQRRAVPITVVKHQLLDPVIEHQFNMDFKDASTAFLRFLTDDVNNNLGGAISIPKMYVEFSRPKLFSLEKALKNSKVRKVAEESDFTDSEPSRADAVFGGTRNLIKGKSFTEGFDKLLESVDFPKTKEEFTKGFMAATNQCNEVFLESTMQSCVLGTTLSTISTNKENLNMTQPIKKVTYVFGKDITDAPDDILLSLIAAGRAQKKHLEEFTDSTKITKQIAEIEEAIKLCIAELDKNEGTKGE